MNKIYHLFRYLYSLREFMFIGNKCVKLPKSRRDYMFYKCIFTYNPFGIRIKH